MRHTPPTPFEIAEAAIACSSTPSIRRHDEIASCVSYHCEICPAFEPSIPACSAVGCTCEGDGKYFNVLTSGSCPLEKF